MGWTDTPAPTSTGGRILLVLVCWAIVAGIGWILYTYGVRP